MSVLFIHGVNVRRADPRYYRDVALRREMFEQVLVPVARDSRWGEFAVEPEVYWGDLGAAFAWDLRSVPRSAVESLGAEDDLAGGDVLLALLASACRSRWAPRSSTEALGAVDLEGSLAYTARQHPSDFVRAVVATQLADEWEEPDGGASHRPPSAGDRARAEAEGRRLALLLLCADEAARDEETIAELRTAFSDEQALRVVADRVEEHCRRHPEGDALPAGIEVLGAGSLVQWATDRLDAAVRSAKRVLDRLQDVAARGPSLLLLSSLRPKLTRPGLHFFGDVFVYLHRGRREVGDTISARIVQALRDAARNPARTGPLVVVSHSFGSMILYDLLSSGRLEDVKIDLWVTAGAQVSLFAEMRLFLASPADVPSPAAPHLAPPHNVARWINVYDAADPLSYLMEPVFGRGSVRDLEIREGAHLGNAHGNYFAEPAFYRIVADELRRLA